MSCIKVESGGRAANAPTWSVIGSLSSPQTFFLLLTLLAS